MTKRRIYNSGTDYCKDPGVYKLLGIDGSILTITDPEEHKQYRSIVSSLFSRKTADDLAPMMSTLLNKSAESMARQGRDDNPSVIQRVYRSIAVRQRIPRPDWNPVDPLRSSQADMVSYLLFNRPLGLIDSPQDADHYHSFMLSIDRFTAITWPSKLEVIVLRRGR